MKLTRHAELEKVITGLAEKTIPGDQTTDLSRIRSLSRAITLAENDYSIAAQIITDPRLSLKQSNTRVIGITGLPGAGKSSLTNQLVAHLRQQNKKVAVLAVDPSSEISGGAFLGDRVRLSQHFGDTGVYIRSMGSRGALGGVARATRGAVRLIKLLDFDYILVETVGIGQSESEILGIADTVVLVLMPQSGDEIQMMKAGILENSHIYVINKADLFDPSRMLMEIEENTTPKNPADWKPAVIATAATKNQGVEAVLAAIESHAKHLNPHTKRNKVKREILEEAQLLLEPLLLESIEKLSETKLAAVEEGSLSATALAATLKDQLMARSKK